MVLIGLNFKLMDVCFKNSFRDKKKIRLNYSSKELISDFRLKLAMFKSTIFDFVHVEHHNMKRNGKIPIEQKKPRFNHQTLYNFKLYISVFIVNVHFKSSLKEKNYL